MPARKPTASKPPPPATTSPSPAGAAVPAPPATQVTMADIAARVGVSKMTVSRALNREGSSSRSTSEALRQRILQACQEMGYVIDQTARTFSSKRSGFVAALVPALNNSNFSDTAHGLTAALEASGLQVLLGYTDYDAATEERLLRAMLSRRPEGVIVTGGTHTAAARRLLQAAGVPVVETWDLPLQPVEHCVGFSNAEAVAQLVHQLHAQGYRRLAFLGGVPESDARGADRRRGFEQAMAALGLDASRQLSVGQAPVSMAHGAQGVVQLLQRWPDTDALVCVSDHPAFGALAECQRRGIAVPQQLAIAGFGGFEVGTSCHPRLSTVAVDCTGIGRAAGELLLRAIAAAREGTPLAPQTVLIPFQVELRGSS
ncbi:LacI family DNA-binding transcriptional regulator [Ideonella sp. BYS139W]|uniref:LacI family DNA-binding transcriptional regulator n=2 Tax=Pseudaquabacterium rugosum TaxID=2984194 RepID=A0ABU9B8D4_9BURK